RRAGGWCSECGASGREQSPNSCPPRASQLKGLAMKKYVLPAVFAAAIVTGAPALAADLKPVYKAAPPPPVSYNPWAVAIGGAVATDYNFRGISQSDRGAAGFGYIEGRYNPNAQFQWYAGIAGATVKLVTDPSAEIDFYGGLRSTFGAFQLDLGLMYYY